jgi:hypothetical protein
MKTPWVRPDFEEISVAGECTAYAGVAPARAPGEPRSQVDPSQPAPPRVRRGEHEDR